MTYVWRLWNYANHSQAYVIADSRAAAKKMRPDGAKWTGTVWALPLTWVKQSLFGGDYRATPTPQTLAHWPDHPDDVLADRLATCGRGPVAAAHDVLGFHPDAALRPPEDRDMLKEADNR